MKFAAVKRWKITQKKFNQKYKLKIGKKAAQSRDFSGKFIFVLSNTNLCAVLKFLSKNVCVTETLIVIDQNFINQISSKYVILKKKHRKLLAQNEVRITDSFRNSCQKYLRNHVQNDASQNNISLDDLEVSNVTETFVESVQQETRKISPIKILSCKICSQKFLKKELLENHVAQEHSTNKESESESEVSDNELFIDDDIELLVDLEKQTSPSNSRLGNNNAILASVAPAKAALTHKCLQCPALCATEEILIAHIERTHPCSSSTANSRLNHINHEKNESISSSNSSPYMSKQSSIESPGSEQRLKYQRFDSRMKTEFKCKICSTSFSNRKYLNRHVTTLHLSTVYRCFQCNVPFNNKLHLLRHLQAAHLKYKDEHGYIATIKNVESVAYFQCCFCKYSSKIKSKVEEHMNNEHYEDFEKNDTLEESVSSSPDSLDELLLPETRALRRQDEFDEEDLLQELIPKDNNKKRKPANDPSFKYRCARCLRRFSRSSWLKKHPCTLTSVTTGTNVSEEPVHKLKKQRLSFQVNGFLRCTKDKCSRLVFTDRKQYDLHMETEH